MKLATWNVNSLKVRLPQVLDWLAARKPDVLCLQETKLEDAKFPIAEILASGYQSIFAGQKTYNGVAILSRSSAEEVTIGLPECDDPQKRVIAATIDGIRILCVYIPNGESVESEKYRYKLDWLQRLNGCLTHELAKYPRVVLLGDYNIAPEDRDVHDPKAWEGRVLFSAPERAAFAALLQLGFIDSFRLFEQSDKFYSWWDYRLNAFKRNMGLRIDHILMSAALAKHCTSCFIDREIRACERPSDHAPVMAQLAL